MDFQNLLMHAIGPIEPPAKEGDVGFNLPADRDYLIPWEGFCFVMTGIYVELPKDVWGLVVARSSCNISEALINMTGVIDVGYRGELGCMIHNVKHRPDPMSLLDEKEDPKKIYRDFEGIWVHKGQSLGQLVCLPRIVPTLVRAQKLSASERGVSGFGSSGNGMVNHGRI